MILACLDLPLRTVSEPNRREHWSRRAKRAADQRGAVRLLLRQAISARRHLAPSRWRVLLTRVAPRRLDDDNLRGALKAVRDGVADALGLDDADPRIEWLYSQGGGLVREYAVRIEIVGTE